jgi:HAD superfamily hydrolase (TIGR01549 family)
MIECIIFDLDGTLIKSHETIYKTTIATLNKLGLDSNFEEEQFYNLLGHHFADIFTGCGIDVPDVEYFIEIYKNLYFDFIEFSELYPNTEKVLRELKDRNIKTGLLTTKGHDQAIKISEHFRINTFLDKIVGRISGIPIKPAPDQFLEICKNLNVNPLNAMMVGDTELDIGCGKNASAKTCAVSYGYRNIEEIIKLNPDYVIEDLIEILELL